MMVFEIRRIYVVRRVQSLVRRAKGEDKRFHAPHPCLLRFGGGGIAKGVADEVCFPVAHSLRLAVRTRIITAHPAAENASLLTLNF